IEVWEAMELPTEMAEDGLYRGVLQDLSKMSASATLELTRKDLEDRLTLFDQYVQEMVAIYMASVPVGTAEMPEELAAFLAFAQEWRAALEQTGAKVLNRQGRGLSRDGERPFSERVSQLEAVANAENQALDAIIEK